MSFIPQPQHMGPANQRPQTRVRAEDGDAAVGGPGDAVFAYTPYNATAARGARNTSSSLRTSSLSSSAVGHSPINTIPRPRGTTAPLDESRVTETRAAARSERPRSILALLVTLAYLVLTVWMFSVSTGPASVGLRGQLRENGVWAVTNIMPAGLAYDAGVKRGDQVLRVDNTPIEQWAAGRSGTDFGDVTSVVLRRADGSTFTVDAGALSGGDPFQRWGYIILGLFFVFVGGPVYVKARQRTAAVTFYAFCISSALALGTAGPAMLGYDWALFFMFISLIVWSASFAFFFLNFPVPMATNTLSRRLVIAGIAGVAAALLASYLWVLAGHPEHYYIVRPIGLLYVVAGVLIGLARLGWTLRTAHSRDVRRQLGLLLMGTGLAVGPALLLSLLPNMIMGRYVVSPMISTLTLGFMPLAFAYAITQHQLLGMRGFVRRGVIYLVMGLSVVLVFSLAAASLSSFVPNGWEREELGVLGFGFFVFLLALSFGYIQKRVERLVDRFIYHDAYDYKEELLKFSAQLAAEQNLDTLGGRLVERTCRLMNLSCGVLLLSVDPKDATSTSMIRPKYNTGNLHAGTLLKDGEPIYARTATGDRYGGDDPFLVPYVQYGDCADWFLNRLQQELQQLGIDLRQADGPTRLFYVNAEAEREHLYGKDLEDDPEPDKSHTASSETMQSFLGVPLWTRQRFVGVLCLGAKRTGERFTKDDVSLLSTLGGQAALAIYNAQLYEMREQALLDTITALAHAIEAKDTYTINHCEKITGRAVALAEHLGLSRAEVENIRLGSILHDVGKIGVPDAILNKPDKLTADEYERIKEHATIGARIVQSVGALQEVVPIVRHHQERYDGKGYPDRLAGNHIPLGARIIAVADAYGAMTEDRIYRKAPGHDVAIAELEKYSGSQFDPDIAGAFIRLLNERPELAE